MQPTEKMGVLRFRSFLAIVVLAAAPCSQALGQGALNVPPGVSSLQATPAPTLAVVPHPAAPTVFQSCCAGLEAKKIAFCNSAIGKFIREMGKPLQALTGGIPGVAPTAAELAAAGPVGVSAKIKAEQMQAKARQAAVRELGLVDCHYFPEAEAMLITALRADSSDCVRFEAARSLSHGCCCSKSVIQALNICLSGSEEDGNPSERSPMVKSAAWVALEVCMNRCGGQENEAGPSVLPRPEFPLPSPSNQEGEVIPAPAPLIQKTAFYQEAEQEPFMLVAARSKRLLAQRNPQPASSPAPVVQQSRSLYEIWVNSASTAARSNPPKPFPASGNPIPRPLQPRSVSPR